MNDIIYCSKSDLIEAFLIATSKVPNSKPEITQNNTEYETRKELKDRTKISYPTMNRLEKNGKIKGYRFGARVLYKKDEIDRAITEIPSIKYKRAR